MLLYEVRPQYFLLAHKEQLQLSVDAYFSLKLSEKGEFIKGLEKENCVFSDAVSAKTNQEIAQLFEQYGIYDIVKPYITEPFHELHYRIEQSLSYNKELLTMIEEKSSHSASSKAKLFTDRYPRMSKVAANKNARTSFKKDAPVAGQFSSKEE